ncbi:MAG: nicotinate-nucleotide adenylyltransferase [Clostridiales bacterium]|nr:nicotinate-nucleotide adenylyltransferase [Clostridiales bacterium]
MGGTFNPVHNGHLLLAEHAREELKLDQVMFIPSGVSYMKDQAHILSADIRFQMVELAVEDNPFFSVSDIEIRKKGNTYTWETIQNLKKIYTGCEFVFLVGADSLFQMENWRNPEKIFAECKIGAAVREGMDYDACLAKAEELKCRFQAEILLLHTERVDISSTDIRSRCREKKSIRYLVPEKVQKFMEEKQLYKQ